MVVHVCCKFMHQNKLMVCFCRCWAGIVRDCDVYVDSCPAAEASQCVLKCNVFNVHQESDDISARSAAEAMENLLVGCYRERWRAFTMKWTEPEPIAPSFC